MEIPPYRLHLHEVRICEKMSALTLICIREDRLEELQELLKRGADPDIPGSYGVPPLWNACLMVSRATVPMITHPSIVSFSYRLLWFLGFASSHHGAA